jgi:hypothetical protein
MDDLSNENPRWQHNQPIVAVQLLSTLILLPVMNPAILIISNQSLYGQCIQKKWWAVGALEMDPIVVNFLSKSMV